ncbi:MAG: hypothetical protein WCS09_09345 [Pseudomonadota bacterium]
MPGRARTAVTRLRRCGGFTYLAVLFLLALAGITATATAVVWRFEQRREMEAELVFVGNEFARAIESYRAVAPNVPQPWPRTLEDLVRDPRTPGVRRHLRKVYRDPMRRSAEWGLIRTQDGGIVGVHSLSRERPMRRVPRPGLTLREPEAYVGWLFVASGAPSIVRDSRSGYWMAVGPTAPVTATAAGSRTIGQTTQAGTSGTQTGNIAPATPAAASSVATPATQPPRPRPNCSVISRNDLSACAAVAQRFGSTDGEACVASARAREAQCSAGVEVTTPLAIRYF